MQRAANDRQVLEREDDAAGVDDPVGEGRLGKVLRLVPPDEAGERAEQEADGYGEDHHGKLRLADDASQHEGIEQIAEHGHGERRHQHAEPVVHAHGADECERHERPRAS